MACDAQRRSEMRAAEQNGKMDEGRVATILGLPVRFWRGAKFGYGAVGCGAVKVGFGLVRSGVVWFGLVW